MIALILTIILASLSLLGFLCYALCIKINQLEGNKNWKKVAQAFQKQAKIKDETIEILELKIKDYNKIVKNLTK